MRKYDLHWLAGILEGEGCFSTNINKRSGKRYFRVQLVGCDLDVLERVNEIFAGRISGPYKTRSKKHAPMYRMNFNGDQAKELMRLIYPLMSERRKQQIDKAFSEAR